MRSSDLCHCNMNYSSHCSSSCQSSFHCSWHCSWHCSCHCSSSLVCGQICKCRHCCCRTLAAGLLVPHCIALALLVVPHDRDDEPTMHDCCSGEVLIVHYSPASNNFCHNRGSVADRGDFEELPTGRVNDIVAAAAFGMLDQLAGDPSTKEGDTSTKEGALNSR